MSQGQTINCTMCFGIFKFLLDGANYIQPLVDRQQKRCGKHLSGMVDQVSDSQHGWARQFYLPTFEYHIDT